MRYKLDHIITLVLIGITFVFSGYIVMKSNVFSRSDEIARLQSLSTPLVKNQPDTEVSVLMNDPSIKKNWGLMGTGGTSDIKANRAWEISRGSREIVVAVIDTGIDVNHPDIKRNLWINREELLGKEGVDDDNNGCVDDIHGCNFITMRGDLTDNHGHGTHVSGIIGAEGGNNIGISGVAPQVSLMVLKYYDPKARFNDNLKNTIKAIDYAVKKGAHIINYSGGGVEFSWEEYQAVKRASEAGVLFVAAAGNEKTNSDTGRYYPADYDLPNIISVTAIDPNAEVLSSSNYGRYTVHIAAPGENIFSTLPHNKYGTMTGTSQATAFVSGVAALIMANNRNLKFDQVKRQILATADEISSLRSKTKTSGKLNSWAALAIQPALPLSGLARVTDNTRTIFNPEVTSSTNPLRDLSQLANTLRTPAQN